MTYREPDGHHGGPSTGEGASEPGGQPGSWARSERWLPPVDRTRPGPRGVGYEPGTRLRSRVMTGDRGSDDPRVPIGPDGQPQWPVMTSPGRVEPAGGQPPWAPGGESPWAPSSQAPWAPGGEPPSAAGESAWGAGGGPSSAAGGESAWAAGGRPAGERDGVRFEQDRPVDALPFDPRPVDAGWREVGWPSGGPATGPVPPAPATGPVPPAPATGPARGGRTYVFVAVLVALALASVGGYLWKSGVLRRNEQRARPTLAAPPVTAPRVSVPRVSVPPASAPPVSAPRVSAPPVAAPPVSVQPEPSAAASPPGTVVDPGSGTFASVAASGPVLGSAGPLHRFHVQVEKGINEDPDAFAAAIDATLGDRRSWIASGGLRLQRVPLGQSAEFTIYLASPTTSEQMCAAGGLTTQKFTSCRIAGKVIINDARWQTAVPDYGEPVSVYRQYAINHEVGHQLGHGHEACPGAGQPAPVMQQQTYGLKGCVANAWPFVNGKRYAGPPVPGT